MVANVHPACCGVAARLPKKPGTQKLTPPSSADAICGSEIAIAATKHCNALGVFMQFIAGSLAGYGYRPALQDQHTSRSERAHTIYRQGATHLLKAVATERQRCV